MGGGKPFAVVIAVEEVLVSYIAHPLGLCFGQIGDSVVKKSENVFVDRFLRVEFGLL